MDSNLKYLSHMRVDLVQHMGSDEMVARSARVSTGKDLIENEKIEGLIKYLVEAQHTSTLEHNVATFRIECPIFVAREFMRHRTMSFNEISGRYSELEPIFYIPDSDRPLRNTGSSARPEMSFGPATDHIMVQKALEAAYISTWTQYQFLIDQGIANEIARVVLPVGIYTRFYVTANLNNWMKFLHLRDGLNGHPQLEIQDVAGKILVDLYDIYELTMKAWDVSRSNSH